jgi:plastocyanin
MSARLAAIAALVLAAVVTIPTAAQDKPRVVQIVITEVAFPVVKETLSIGDVIEWVNNDVVDHTATARNKDWDVVIRAGRKVRMPLKKAGVVDYFCKYHPNMTGKMTIK